MTKMWLITDRDNTKDSKNNIYSIVNLLPDFSSHFKEMFFATSTREGSMIPQLNLKSLKLLSPSLFGYLRYKRIELWKKALLSILMAHDIMVIIVLWAYQL